MRIKWILAGVFGTSAIAVASPSLQFYTVINQGDSIAGDQFGVAGQVVVGDGGVVGMVAQLNTSGNAIVIYSTPAAGNTWNSQTVLEASTPTAVSGLGANQLFESFDNLALTSNPSGGTRLTFAAVNPSDQAGILQWDDNASITSLGDVAFEGDGKGYSKVGNDGTDSGAGTLEMQVNGSGQVLFPAVVSAKQSLVRGDTSSLTTVLTSGGGATISDPGSRVGLGSNNTSASVLNTGTNRAIFTIPASGGVPTQITGSPAPVSFDPLIGYSSSTGAVIVVNGSGSGKENVEYVPAGGGAPQPVAVNEFTPGSSPLSPPVGEITPNGQIAVYIPDTVAGDTIQYGNAGTGNPQASVIASVAGSLQAAAHPATDIALDPSASSLEIEALQDPSGATPWVPQINANGTTVFNAEIGTSPSSEKKALLDWQVGAASPTVVLAVGDQLNIGGQPVEIDDFLLNSLQNENDYFKNALSDDNYLAISVEYTDLGGADAGDTGTAVIITQVPEPAAMALVSIGGLSLLARRKRRH
ncbi:MAG: PEP-CTERM sorting domain-containing protein [Tepidisphaeraceae bacterium]